MTFRIRMARQAGEAEAGRRGFEAFPIDPFAIAAHHEIEVVPKPSDAEGVSGAIIFSDEYVTIIYATNIRSEGFRRFTVAHELGHYLLDGHAEEICTAGGHHFSRAGFTQCDRRIEIEADHFASGLLMPTRLVKQVLNRSAVGLEGVLELADQAECSATASAIRAAECAEHPLCVVVSEGDVVCYSFMSETFKALKPGGFLRKGASLPYGLTRRFNEDPGRIEVGEQDCSQTDMADWFGGRSLPLDEEVIGLGGYGRTLTVLSSEELTSIDDEDPNDEDESLERSWEPRFAYGR